jgi:hypothetical protein
MRYQTINLEPETYYIEVTMGCDVRTGQITTPPFIAKEEFKSLVMQLAHDVRPCKVKFSKPERIWVQFEQRFKELDLYVEFTNNAWEDSYAEQK